MVEDALAWARRSLVYFPKPVELIEWIKEEKRSRYNREHPLYDTKAIEWKEPTEDGRRIALQVIKELYEKWEKKEKAEVAEREGLFHKKRDELKKQARLMREGGVR